MVKYFLRLQTIHVQVSRAKRTQWALKDTHSWRLGKLEVLFDNPEWSDIKLRANIVVPHEEDDGREFYYGQKAYLASWSPVLDSIFYNNNQTNGDPVPSAIGALDNGELTLDCLKDILRLFLR